MAIQFSEQDLEDWAELNIREVLGLDEECVADVWRQFMLPTGRIVDLLVCHEVPATEKDPPLVVFNVVELKAVTVDGRALAQLVDYLATLRDGFGSFIEQHKEIDPSTPKKFVLAGTLAGPDATEEVLRAVRYIRNVDFRAVRATFQASRFSALQQHTPDYSERSEGLLQGCFDQFLETVEEDRRLTEHFATLAASEPADE